MEIVVNDTNILIDLFNAGLLKYCRQLDVDFRTLDLIVAEVTDNEQRNAIENIINDGVLSVCSMSGEQMSVVYDKVLQYNGVCNLSLQDISVMVYAIEHNCRLLTGDKKLREKAAMENVKVSGILFLTDMMTQSGIVEPADMIKALELLIESNPRTPKKLIQERIEKLNLML